jgi:XTP/dITP diphosphohydrolase
MPTTRNRWSDGMWLGEVQDTAAGEGGFGYDPYFYLPEFGCTVAQLAAEDKNRVSHRGKAMQAMLSQTA